MHSYQLALGAHRAEGEPGRILTTCDRGGGETSKVDVPPKVLNAVQESLH